MEQLPQAIASSSFEVFGVEVKCHVLSDGRRIIEADSMHKLFAAMENGAPVDQEDADFQALARFLRGQSSAG